MELRTRSCPRYQINCKSCYNSCIKTKLWFQYVNVSTRIIDHCEMERQIAYYEWLMTVVSAVGTRGKRKGRGYSDVMRAAHDLSAPSIWRWWIAAAIGRINEECPGGGWSCCYAGHCCQWDNNELIEPEIAWIDACGPGLSVTSHVDLEGMQNSYFLWYTT